MRRNILNWVCSTMRDATSAIVLTHNIDFLFLQSILRPRLRKCGHPKLTVFADAGCAGESYGQQRLLLEGLGRHYRVVPVEMGPGRRFHPKAILLSGPTKAVLAVGSGNLTHGGWSANREIWATYDSDDDGLPALAAFRDYLATVLGLVSQGESINDEVLATFEQVTQPWAANMPEPAGLHGTPSDRPLLDRIVELANNDVQSVTVCAPYYDPDGEALGEIGRRLPVPVTTLLQKNHVGLTETAAASRPSNVSLVSVDTDPPRFIHAKLFAFRRPKSTLLIAGSANVSRAALMASLTWGNAELVSAQEVSHEQIDELLADLLILDGEPVLPDTPPSEEWEIPTAPLRILAARFIDGILDVIFKPVGPLLDVVVELDDGTWQPATENPITRAARFLLKKCPTSVRLRGSLGDGSVVSSEAAWVDDEASLGISVPERRIAAKLMEAAEAGSLSAGGMFEILQLLHQHLQQPARSLSHRGSAPESKTKTFVRSYGVEDVFSDSFGRPHAFPPGTPSGGFREADFFKAFMAYFNIDDADELQESAEETDETEVQEIEDTKAREELERRQATLRRGEEGARLRTKLMGALEKVIKAMSADEFVASRPPDRLGADIAATALLLRKGLADRILSEEDFASVTERLWTVLFFGNNGGTVGVIPMRLHHADVDAAAAFESALASPRLTAALILWCFPNWRGDTSGAARFRFTAGLLAAKLPWLIAGGMPEEVATELRRLSRAMHTGANFESLLEAWRGWLQAGTAFRDFENAVKSSTPRDLAELVNVAEVVRGELLWQAGEFCVAEAPFRREARTRATVWPLGRSEPKKIVGSWLVPVMALLKDPKLLGMHEPARQVLFGMVAAVEGLSLQE